MRHRGLIVKEDYFCCPGCALRMINELGAQYTEQGKELLGYGVYDERSANIVESGCDLIVQFGQLKHPRIGRIGVIAEQVGKIVCECQMKFGLPHEVDIDLGTALISGNYLRSEME